MERAMSQMNPNRGIPPLTLLTERKVSSVKPIAIKVELKDAPIPSNKVKSCIPKKEQRLPNLAKKVSQNNNQKPESKWVVQDLPVNKMLLAMEKKQNKAQMVQKIKIK